MRSQTDYILGMDRRLFWNVSVRDPRHNSDHYMVMGCLRISPLREHTKYLWGRKRLPLQLPTALAREDGIFAAPGRAVPKPKAQDARKNVCTSEAMWRLIDERVSVCRYPAKDQTLIWGLGRAIAASLKGNRRRRAEEAVKEVETLLRLEHLLHREA